MKIAHLPNGKILRFPEGTPDDAIDETVRNHIADVIAEAEQSKSQEDSEKLEKETRSQREAQRAARQHNDVIRRHDDHNGMLAKNHAEMMATQMQWHAEDRQVHATLHQQRDLVLQQITKQLFDINMALNTLSTTMPAIHKAISDMATQVSQSGSSIVQALLTPKELTFDQRGRPVSVKPKKTELEE